MLWSLTKINVCISKDIQITNKQKLLLEWTLYN